MKVLITLISIFVVAFTVATIVAGSRNFDGVVVDKPYETGLAWDKTREQKAKLGWTVSFRESRYRPGRNEILIAVLDKKGRILEKPAVTVRISRPETVRYDKTYATALRSDGKLSAAVDLPVSGNWNLIVSVRHGSEQAEFTYHIFAENN